MDNHTICALATATGGAIGIVRVSGEKAIEITDRIFKSTRLKTLCDAKGNSLHYGEVHDKEGNVIDEVLVSIFRSPHSYTGEDSTEISCHGSAYILNQVVKALIDAGCRQAQPGEYTQRAYLNGKMDLSQAEAVADLIAASNRATHQVALSQLKGHFSSELSLLREQLLKMTSLLELELDFSDHEELEFADRTELKALAETIHQKIRTLTNSFETGKALKKGVPVAIVGKTNVGKSTLLNCLLHEEKAIVSDIHGTTRDVIEAAASKWNFIKLSPGLVGGHCISVDPYYLIQKAQVYGVLPRIMSSARRLNDGMGDYVANQTIKCMNKKGIMVKDANILILGITFKENCPDVRNTKVVDIYQTLLEYSNNIKIYDPWANPEIVKKHYNIHIQQDLTQVEDTKYDAVILAVSHKEFLNMDIRSLLKNKEKGVVYDVKGVLPTDIIDARL